MKIDVADFLIKIQVTIATQIRIDLYHKMFLFILIDIKNINKTIV